jgi:hypothetical protein
VKAEPLANLTGPLANLVILSTDAFYRGEGSASRFWIAGRHFVLVECGERQMQILRPKKRAQNDGVTAPSEEERKANAGSSPQKAGSE